MNEIGPGRAAIAGTARSRPASLGPPAGPRNELELYLGTLWEDALRIAPIGIDDDFFMLGGDSLAAAAVFATIERDLGIKAPLSTLLDRASIALLAPALEGGLDPDAVLVPLRSTGALPPVFCVHPGGIEVFAYRDLVEALGPDQPVYGLRAAWAGRPNPPTTVPEMAALYLAALRSRQPHGPYRIVAFCLGGSIAFEIASQLCRIGEEIALLALADTPSPPPPLGQRLQANAGYALRNLGRGGLGHLAGRLRQRLLARPRPPVHAEAPERHRTFMAILRSALDGYRPAPCPLPSVLGLSDDAGGENWSTVYGSRAVGWDRLLGGRLEIIRQPVGHVSLFHHPSVGLLARRIAAARPA